MLPLLQAFFLIKFEDWELITQENRFVLSDRQLKTDENVWMFSESKIGRVDRACVCVYESAFE